MIVSLKGLTSRDEVNKFMEDYWVPVEYEFNIDTQEFEVFVRPFDKMKD